MNRRLLIPLLLLLLLLVNSCDVIQGNDSTQGSPLHGSGTVEATEVIIAPELAGRVAEVLVARGDTVESGTPLFRLEDELLTAQRQQALAALDAAQAGLATAQAALVTTQAWVESSRAQYELEFNATRLQDQPRRTSEWLQGEPEEFTLPVWYFTKPEEIAAAQAEVVAAERALAVEQENFDATLADISNVEFLEAETRLAQAQATFLVAQDILLRTQAQDDQSLIDFAQESFDSADAELSAAQSAYDQLISAQSAIEVLEARARLALASERYETALDRYNGLLTGEDSLRVQAAVATLAYAEAQVTQVESQISQAETAVSQAQAQLDLIDVQMSKLVVYAPVSGVVLSRNVEPGEILQPGAAAMTIGQLDQLTITVYIPEDRYGEIKLGEHAQVTVDSFPGQIFDATIVRIADRAEFTPRNVQTEEGRRTTVFAVECSVDDSSGRLKPGMPADVTFGK